MRLFPAPLITVHVSRGCTESAHLRWTASLVRSLAIRHGSVRGSLPPRSSARTLTELECGQPQSASLACQRRPTPRVFQLLQLTLARLCRSVATGRLVCLSWAAMHRSDPAIFRFRLAMVFFVWRVESASSPILNRAVSKAFTASRFFLSWTLCQAMLLLLSAIM